MGAGYRKQTPDEGEGIYESFSDMVLCTVIVLITMVVVLALNVMQQNLYIEPNHFGGGATRPWIHIQAQSADYSKTTTARLAMERAAYGDDPFVLVNLFSPSSAQSATTVENGEVISAKEGQSFHGQCDLTAHAFLQLAAGLEPGSFPVEGEQTALLLPKFSHKSVMLDATGEGYATRPSNELALRSMAMAWPIYENELFPRRAARDYREARSKIYVEALESDDGTHRVMIGHSVFELPRDIENGRLGWLAGFSSGLTELIYLGTAWNDPEAKNNKRIDYFERNGFQVAADDYRAFSYPRDLSASQAALKRELAEIRPDLSAKQLEAYVRTVDAQRKISAAIVEGGSRRSLLPPLLAHRDAWKAYVDHCVKAEAHNAPPEWLLTEFLEPLGFDQAVVRGLREDA